MPSSSCENVVIWRGHFRGSSATTSVNLTINGGTGKLSCTVTDSSLVPHVALLGFAASVWINDDFIASTSGGTSSEQTNALYTFPKGSVKSGRDNVITVIHVRFSATVHIVQTDTHIS